LVAQKRRSFCRIRGVRDCFRRKILRDLALTAAARFAVGDKIVPYLGRDHDFVALLWKRFRDQFLTQTVSVSVSRIKKRDAEVERLVHERGRLAFSEISPPASGNRPKPKADLAHSKIGVFVGAKTHGVTLTLLKREPRCKEHRCFAVRQAGRLRTR
jgi:hypothetical protein